MSESKTSATGAFGKAQAPAQRKCWIEIQIVDENDNAVANMPWRAENEATRDKVIAPYTGVTDSEGVLRIDDLLHPDLTLFIEAQPLADEMEQRPLSIERINSYSMKMSPVTIDKKTGLICYYVVIGQLCGKAPQIPGWEGKELPVFHFPDPEFSGLTISNMYFNSRVVVKVCPFRAWNVLLHHTSEYSIINAYNLSLLADFAYSKDEKINSFVSQDCLDLSKVPSLLYDVVAVDVPFRERYEKVIFLDTTVGVAEGGTQLFSIRNKKQLIIAWRGTEPDDPADIETDGTFRPVPCPNVIETGRGHKGFLDAYELVHNKFQDDFKSFLDNAENHDLFICGHSLGGALGLIQAVVLKNYNPLLYTFGMPRVFCESTVRMIEQINHYRHVNDTDTVTQIPPQMELDNCMYDKWGPLGTLFGFQVSLLQLSSQLHGAKFGDPYWHQGKVVFFFTAEQTYVKKDKRITPLIGMDVNKPYLTITQVSFRKAKLYLVPELNKSLLQSSSEAQNKFIKTINPESLQRYFPNNQNPHLQSGTNPINHLMSSEYVPFIHNQLVELLVPGKELESKLQKDEFTKEVVQSKKMATGTSSDEVARNEDFLNLQSAISITLNISTTQNVWNNALSRFKIKEGGAQ